VPEIIFPYICARNKLFLKDVRNPPSVDPQNMLRGVAETFSKD